MLIKWCETIQLRKNIYDAYTFKSIFFFIYRDQENKKKYTSQAACITVYVHVASMDHTFLPVKSVEKKLCFIL